MARRVDAIAIASHLSDYSDDNDISDINESEDNDRSKTIDSDSSSNWLPLESTISTLSSSTTSSLLPADEIQAPVTNLLQVLRSPRPSDLARKRRVASNPVPPVGKRRKSRGSSSSSSEPKTVTVQQRVREYPDEPFDKSSGLTFCFLFITTTIMAMFSPSSHYINYRSGRKG